MLLFFYLDSYSQQNIPQRSHAITYSSSSQSDVPDTLTIVAVRVEFQQDANRLTTGDGTFDTNNLSYLNKPEVTIDPLPHDKSYFENHLLFAKNYFEKVSGNQITVEYRVLSDEYQLPKKMEAYAPTGEPFTNEKVAGLVKDTWQAVEQQGGFSTAGLNPDKTAFAIFHAGVGRDIELIGTTLDKTPQDIPSLFLNQQSLSDLLDDPDFDGFDINGGTFKVTNSLILPRTLSRRGEDFNGNEFVLQLSINGLLCASIGSYLGLPDLFNTNTGASGIGRFGLMDGESFFSYRGLFPPEPSAWEKIYLGWQTPFSITTGINGDISLPAASLHQNNSVAKYSLSGDEYFLIENRHRDPDSNGVTLTFRQPDGTLQTKQFDNYDEAFVNQTGNFEEELVTGVVTDVSNFDWSLPGGLDPGPDESASTGDDRLLNGGILIWHIDEAVIEKELNSQTVNANPDRRGVDLEEADGAQDIGRAANENFSSQARGTAFDFWWDGNNASVVTLDGDTLSFYENRFGPDTRPSNENNSGAPAFFEFYDFSENQATATFRIRSRSANNIESVPLPVNTLNDQTTFTATDADYFYSYPLGISLFETQADSFLIIPSQQSTYAVNLNGGANPVFDFQSGPHQQPYLNDNLILGDMPSGPQVELTSWQWDGSNWNIFWDIQAQANDGFLSSIDEQTLLLDFTNQRINLSNGSFQTSLPEANQRSVSLEGQYTSLTATGLILNPDSDSYAVTTSGDRLYTGALELSDNQPAFYLLSDSNLKIFKPNAFDQPITIVQNTPLEWPALTDINKDGCTDFIFVNKETNALEARNINGTLLSNFPIRPPEGSHFIGTPLIAASKSDETILFVTAQDSLSMQIYAYRSDGQAVEGFPLFAGSVSSQENQPIHPVIHEQTLYAVSHRGELKSWRMDFIDEVLWGSRYGNSTTNKVSGYLNTEGVQNPSSKKEILSDKETYNWPNPAEDFTNLRFQTAASGVVDVKVITPGGRVVFEERYQSNGILPQEHRVSTQNWSSGLYFAMITATIDGEKASKMLKIVVVR